MFNRMEVLYLMRKLLHNCILHYIVYYILYILHYIRHRNSCVDSILHVLQTQKAFLIGSIKPLNPIGLIPLLISMDIHIFHIFMNIHFRVITIKCIKIMELYLIEVLCTI